MYNVYKRLKEVFSKRFLNKSKKRLLLPGLSISFVLCWNIVFKLYDAFHVYIIFKGRPWKVLLGYSTDVPIGCPTGKIDVLAMS